jgi:hypothetical protein
MSSQGETSPKPEARRASVTAHPELGSADDAAILGIHLSQYNGAGELTDSNVQQSLDTSKSSGETLL